MEIGATVLVADGDDDSRTALTELLKRAGYAVIDTDRGDTALSLAQSIGPSAVILEIALDGLCGYEVCQLLKSQPGYQVPVVLVSGTRTEPHDRIAGLLLKADDYIVRPFADGELLARLSNLIRRFHAQGSGMPRILTRREEQVLQLMSEGLRQGEIARRLFISPKTVATHVEHILRKLGARSSTEAVAVAYREEIIRPTLEPVAHASDQKDGAARRPVRAARRFGR
jgi:DNA-binding NarL/FixJ family response regulator